MKNTLSAKDISWTNITNPEANELAEFIRNSNISPVDAEFIVQGYHRPEITHRPNYIIIMIQVPVFDKKLRKTSGVPLYFVITSSNLWTIRHEEIIVLDRIIEDFESNPEKQAEYFSDTPLSLALHIISRLYATAFHKLEKLNKHIEIAADAVFKGNERKMVEEIAFLTRDVADFRKVMRPQQNLFSISPTHSLITEDLTADWYRLHGQIKKIWELLESLLESVKELGKTNNALLQHKENELLRFLTIYSIIAIPLWVLITAYVPDGPDATMAELIIFWGVFIVLVALLLLMFLRFKSKKVL